MNAIPANLLVHLKSITSWICGIGCPFSITSSTSLLLLCFDGLDFPFGVCLHLHQHAFWFSFWCVFAFTSTWLLIFLLVCATFASTCLLMFLSCVFTFASTCLLIFLSCVFYICINMPCIFCGSITILVVYKHIQRSSLNLD